MTAMLVVCVEVQTCFHPGSPLPLALPHTNYYLNAGGIRSSLGFYFYLCHSSVTLLPFPVSALSSLFVALKSYFCYAAAGQRMGQLHPRGEPVLPCLYRPLQRQAVQQEAE